MKLLSKNTIVFVKETTVCDIVIVKFLSVCLLYLLYYYSIYSLCIYLFCHLLDYRVAIICSLENEERAHVISKLHQYRREYPPLPSTTQIASYLKQHLINDDPSCAARVDPEM